MGIYFDSNGNRYTQGQIDRRITKAKSNIKQTREYYCNDCGLNTFGLIKFKKTPFIDMSHDISIAQAKVNRQVELCWSEDNITLRCRECHKIKDNNQIFKR